jgi:predicted DNA-binding protein
MKKQTNIRLPDSTTEQLDQLAEALGMTKTQVLILAIRALHEAEKRKGTFK